MLDKKKFLEKYQNVPVKEFENNVSKKPLVSVCVQTYQQEDYIGKCLDGILMQKTNFSFEILVGEDESKDGTREICIEYAKKFPDKIILYLHSRENNIKVYGKPTSLFNARYNVLSARGKYLAFCEGDDFWIDPTKLQKQIDFLENNKDYGLIYSDINLVDQYNNDNNDDLLAGYIRRYERVRKFFKSGNIFWEILEKNLINTLTVCVKRDLVIHYFDMFEEEEFTYDHRCWMHVASYSKIKYINDIWGTYRVLDQGISNSNGFFNKRSPLSKQSALVHYMSIINFESDLIDKSIFSKVAYNVLKSKHLTKEDKKPLIRLFKKHPIYLGYVLAWRIKKIFRGK